MKRTDPQYKLRIPEDLKARVEEAAKANNRSMNAEIVSRLEESLNTVAIDLSQFLQIPMTEEEVLAARISQMKQHVSYLSDLIKEVDKSSAKMSRSSPQSSLGGTKPHDPAEGGNGKPPHADPKEGGNGKPKGKKAKTSKP